MVHEVRSQQYERNAEPLPHVQHHTVFKGFLAGFYKLHKEAEGEYGSEAVAEIETGIYSVVLYFLYNRKPMIKIRR